MNITDMLNQTGGLQSIARELGISEADAASGAAALAPAILGGMKKQAQAQPDGLAGLGGLLTQLGGGDLLTDVLSPQPTNVNRGNDVLGQIFGSKDVSRTVAQAASAQSGVDSSVLKQMLPMLTMLIAGSMSGSGQTTTSSGGLAGLLGGMLGGSGGRGTSSTLGGLASMLDLNQDGNPLDDLMRMAGRRS